MLQEARTFVELGRLAEAETSLSRFLKSNPTSVEATTLLGIVYSKSGRFELAVELLEGVLSREPNYLEALTWLAAVRMSQRRFGEAIEILERLLKLKPNDAESYNLLGSCLLSLGRAGEAEKAFTASIGLHPSAPPFSNLGMALRLQNRGDEALAAFQRAAELSPDHPQNHLQLFKQFQQLSRWDEAIKSLRIGLRLHPESLLLAEALAVALGRLKQNAEAEAIFRDISQSSPRAANSYAIWLQEEGRFKDSVPVLQHSLRLEPLQGAPYLNLVEAKQFHLDGKPILDSALTLAADPRLNDQARMPLAYALGKIYDHEEDYSAAISWFDTGNEIAYRLYPTCQTFDPVWTKREPELASQLYTKAFMERSALMGSPDSRPIFIVGMIRSGTTLLDQIVSAHPDVASVGEGTFWNVEGDSIHPRWMKDSPTGKEIASLADRYLASVGVRSQDGRFTDKMPLNYRHLGLIRAVFPEARILHIRRDPLDTCLSIYFTFFGGGPNFAYRQENIVAFYRAYQAHMEHWRNALPADRLFELDYETLVTEPGPLTRRIIEFLDLPWSEACLRPEQNRDQVATPSRWQARQPFYKTSIGKGRLYERWLGALRDLIGS
jgi:tetratricopeptide (TPR) repeat protein